MGLTPADSGDCRLNGQTLDRRRSPLRRIAGLVPQHIALYPSLSGMENLQLFAGLLWQDRQQRQAAIKEASEMADLGEAMAIQVGKYSGGQKRRLNLAVGLLGKPQILFLDEPTVGIDPQSRHFILDAIRHLSRERGMTVVHTTHYMEEVEQLCDDLAIIDHGKVLINQALDEALLSPSASGPLEIRLASPPDRQQLDRLEKAGLKPLRLSGRRIYFSKPETTQGLSQGLSQLLDTLHQQDLKVSAVRSGASLEQLFLALTGHELRE